MYRRATTAVGGTLRRRAGRCGCSMREQCSLRGRSPGGARLHPAPGSAPGAALPACVLCTLETTEAPTNRSAEPALLLLLPPPGSRPDGRRRSELLLAPM
ncbi:hypothetical protein T484DRAFT_1913236 [Baffinella frigidus]|nr:hypothetical protein T484DRAFT_1913236 [Cryptophyta sp. CCMP2293]